jgi:signal transduction histidine kinase
MTIRRILLFSFLLISLLPITGLTALSFRQARKGLETEISRNLLVEASAVMTQIDWMLFERMENVRTWTQLEVMQEIRIDDLDKRISHLLTDLKAGYEVYEHLACIANGRVIAASDPDLLGQHVPTQPVWLTATLPKGTVRLTPLLFTPSAAHLLIQTPVVDSYSQGETLGMLSALFDWTEVFRILDQVEEEASTGPATQRMALLLDQDGRVIAASSLARQRGLLQSVALASWSAQKKLRNADRGVTTIDGRSFGTTKVLMGYANSHGYRSFSGLGWSTVVLQPTPQAFLPIQHMQFSFVLFLTLACALAVAASYFIAGALARPIHRLAEFSRRFVRTGARETPPPVGRGEIGELSQAFTQMVRDLERSREDLIRAAKLAVVGEMAATMAHEVRTPLGILRSSAQMLEREAHLSPRGQEMVRYVVSETDRLNRLVSTLLESARPSPPEFAPRDVHAIIEHALELLTQRADRRQITLAVELQATPSILLCDGEQLTQVILNLVLNALQILPEEATVIVRTATEAEHLILEVIDNGPGVPPEIRPRIFDHFFTTREGGVGLGLTVVQQILTAHSGTITVSEGLSGGACFRCSFPYLAEGEVDEPTAYTGRR